MAYNITSLDDLDTLFANFIQQQLGMQGDEVLISNQEEGQISFKFNKNILYVKTYQEDDQVSIYKNRTRQYVQQEHGVVTTQRSMRVILLQLVFYGPNADVLSTRANEMFYLFDARDFLYDNNLSLIPDRTKHPIRIYEKINERWWRRADVELRFYNSIMVTENNGYIESAEVDGYVNSGDKTIELEVDV